MRDESAAEVKAVVAYPGKEEGRRRDPVRLGCVGEAQYVNGADAMARLRSWIGSGFALPARSRESAMPRGRRARREERLAAHLVRAADGRVKSEGKGWEYPLTASLDDFGADIRYEAAGGPLGW